MALDVELIVEAKSDLRLQTRGSDGKGVDAKCQARNGRDFGRVTVVGSERLEVGCFLF
jgi:hypothetical protein